MGEEPGIDLPILGTISAGLPVDAVEGRETMCLPSPMAPKARYALRRRGNSMVEDQIQDGDIILIDQRQTTENSETVVALFQCPPRPLGLPLTVKTREIVYLLFKQPWAPLLPILQGLNGREMA